MNIQNAQLHSGQKRKRGEAVAFVSPSPTEVISCFYETSDIPSGLDRLSSLVAGLQREERVSSLLRPELLSRLSIW